MTQPEIAHTHAHPSDFSLDQLYLGELPSPREESLREHIRSCLHCKKRQTLRENGLAAFPEVDSNALFQRIESAVQLASPKNNSKNPPSRVFLYATPVVLCAAALLLYVSLPSDSANSGQSPSAQEGLRSKGGLALRVYRQSHLGAEEQISGQDFYKGDKIRFVIDLPLAAPLSAKSNVMLLSVEEDGDKTSVYFPTDSNESAPLSLDGEGALPIATKLDGYVGLETLLVVICPTRFSFEDLSFRKDADGFSELSQLKEGCLQSRFRIKKQK